MNTTSRQKFLSLFNEMLTDRNGTNIKSVLHAQNGGDEVDQISNMKEQSLHTRLDQRNLLFLKKVEEAKQKIEEGTYGICEECECDISQKRLMARPTAVFCIDCQEEKERNEMGTFSRKNAAKSISEDNVGEHISDRETFNSIKDIHFESVVDL